MPANKKRIIKSLETLAADLQEMVKRHYPAGYESSITRIMNAKNEPIFVFPLETEDTMYLIKVPVTKNSDGEYDIDSSDREEFDDSDSSDEDSFGSDDNFESGGDDYEGGGEKSSREASYNPDFDN